MTVAFYGSAITNIIHRHGNIPTGEGFCKYKSASKRLGKHFRMDEDFFTYM
jgi:hypothetical protein